MERRPRGPGLVNGTIAFALLVLVAAVALTARQPPPPSVAELAPQAQQQIKDAPNEQSSRFGSGPGGDAGDGGGAAAATTTTTSTTIAGAPKQVTIDRARVRRCIGDPPRQIEDAQSPPCVPYWEGDNGGATSKGVTRDQINIVVPNWDANMHPALQTFFNNRFEFYGRKLRLIQLNGAGGDSPEAQQADATLAANERDAFASTDNSAGGGFDYYEQLARLKVISAPTRPSQITPYQRQWSPYVWQYTMAVDDIMRNLGEWGCVRLAGANATHAGGDLPTKKRKFGVILQQESADNPLSTKPIEEALAACGEQPVIVSYGATSYNDPSKATNVILQMKQENVTTIICLCHMSGVKVLGAAASSQVYYPEWIVSTYGLGDFNYAIRTLGPPPEQRVHLMGITVQPRQVKVVDDPVQWAWKESDPSANELKPISGSMEYNDTEYRSMLLLASGIQMAGPRLTPETFAAALEKTVFPNPDTPHMQGHVGFSPRSHSMTIDAAEWWWSDTDQSPYTDESSGTICYVEHGARRTLGKWPKRESDPLFTGPCDSGA
jgi:hypothetical protein